MKEKNKINCLNQALFFYYRNKEIGGVACKKINGFYVLYVRIKLALKLERTPDLKISHYTVLNVNRKP